jgi:hypothetical protein
MMVFAMDFSSTTVVSLSKMSYPVLGIFTGILLVGNPLLKSG